MAPTPLSFRRRQIVARSRRGKLSLTAVALAVGAGAAGIGFVPAVGAQAPPTAPGNAQVTTTVSTAVRVLPTSSSLPVTTRAVTAAPTTALRPTTTVITSTRVMPSTAPTSAARQTPTTTGVAPTSQAPTTRADAATTSTLNSPLLVAGPNDTRPRGDTAGADPLTPGTKLKAIIAGLLGLALVVLLLTIGYARHTRPDDWEYWDDDDYAEDGEQSAAPVQSTGSAAPVVPSLVPAGLTIPRVQNGTSENVGSGDSSVDEPTQAFQMPATAAGPVSFAATSLPIVTLEDLEKSVNVNASDTIEPSIDRTPGETAAKPPTKPPTAPPVESHVAAPAAQADIGDEPKSPSSSE